MKTSDLDFNYPEDLIALEPRRPSRVLSCLRKKNEGEEGASPHPHSSGGGPEEISIPQLLECFSRDDILVINNTQVLKRRLFGGPDGKIEILFLNEIQKHQDGSLWEVLFPSKDLPLGTLVELPGGQHRMTLLQKGRPQKVSVSPTPDETYFFKWGELPLPPYIQEARGLRHTRPEDDQWYTTPWGTQPGSMASPTASLHFTPEDLSYLINSIGVHICEITLHVGMGTFLPVRTEDLSHHPMHQEYVEIPYRTQKVLSEKSPHQKIWALGTTVTRALESWALGLLGPEGRGWTSLLIQEGFEFHLVDRLLTNFHQPRSTLLALVGAFVGDLQQVKTAYAHAIDRKFRLFSYGDLSAWDRPQESHQTKETR